MPRNSADWPSSSSMRRSWLYLQMRSVRLAEPVLIWAAPGATAESAMKGSSVSPERWPIRGPVAGDRRGHRGYRRGSLQILAADQCLFFRVVGGDRPGPRASWERHYFVRCWESV